MNNLCCWLVTCRPGNSVLVTGVEKPIWPAHAAARRRKANAYVTGRTEPPVGLVHPIIGPLRPAIRSCRQPAIRAAAEHLMSHPECDLLWVDEDGINRRPLVDIPHWPGMNRFMRDPETALGRLLG